MKLSLTSVRCASFLFAVLGGIVLLIPRTTGAAGTAVGTPAVAVPASGDITVARIPLTITSGHRKLRLPRARVRNASALPPDTAAYTGVRFKPHSRRAMEVLVVLLRPRAASGVKDVSSAVAGIAVSVPRGVRVKWGRTSEAVSAFSNAARPAALCSFRIGQPPRIRAQLVTGRALSYPPGTRAPALTVLKASLAAVCGRPYDPGFRQAIEGPATAPVGSPPPPPQPIGPPATLPPGGSGTPPPAAPPALRWSYLDAQKQAVVGALMSDTAFDRLEVRVPVVMSRDRYGPPDVIRKIVSFAAPSQLPDCSIMTTKAVDDTLACVGGTVAAGEQVSLRVSTDPPPTDGMGGSFVLARSTAARGPFSIAGP